MSLASNRLLLRLGRWPRRCAAIAFLILAVNSAVSAHSHSVVHRPKPIAKGLRPNEVAVPVPLTGATPAGFIHVGDRIGLAASGRLIADRLRVIAILETASADAKQTIVVAAERPTVTRIASAVGGNLLPVLDNSAQ